MARSLGVGLTLRWVRRHPRFAALAVSASLGLAYFSSWVPGLRGVVLDAAGQPVAGALVVYGYLGSVPMPTPHPSSAGVVRSGGLVRADADGRFRIPSRLCLCCPEMRLRIQCVFAGALHSALDASGDPLRAWFHRESPAPKVERHFAHPDYVDREFVVEARDQTGDPVGWLRSLEELAGAALQGPLCVELGASDRAAVVSTLVEEYRTFAARYGHRRAGRNQRFGAWSDRRQQWSYEPYVLGRIAMLQSE